MPAAEVLDSRPYGLLHANLNTRDLEAATAFYTTQLGMRVLMSTDDTPIDGAALGMPGLTRSRCHFVYDDRGPRAAPAIELLQWIDPAPIVVDKEPRRGFSVLGFDAPASDRLTDPDGVVVELRAGDVPAPRFTRLTLTVSDPEASARWYTRLGLEPDGTDVLVGDTRLEFVAGPEAAPAPTRANSVGLFRIALGVDDIDAACRSVRSYADVGDPVYIPLPGTKLGGVHVLFLSDPDGLVVELVGRPR